MEGESAKPRKSPSSGSATLRAAAFPAEVDLRGMEVIDALCADLALCQRDSMGFLGVDDQPIIESIRILD